MAAVSYEANHFRSKQSKLDVTSDCCTKGLKAHFVDLLHWAPSCSSPGTHLVLVNDLPAASRRRVGGHALKHNIDSPVQHWPVRQVAAQNSSMARKLWLRSRFVSLHKANSDEAAVGLLPSSAQMSYRLKQCSKRREGKRLLCSSCFLSLFPSVPPSSFFL